MGALLAFDLNVDAGVDYSASLTIYGQGGAQVAFAGAGLSAELAIRISPLDPAPLITVPVPTGSLALGAAPPSPIGTNVVNLAELELAGYPLSFVTTTPSPVVAQAATVAAMAALTTSGFAVAQVCLVTAAVGSFYQWSPADPLPPNGTTIVAGIGGNWLLAPTIGIVIPAAATALLAGYASAYYDLVVTWTDGSTLKLFSGLVYVCQTNNPIV